MGREVKRVPVDFDWPLDKVWRGFQPDETEARWDDLREEYVTPTGEVWESYEPPTGDGWQVWETVSEGSAITPVFATADALVEHLSTIGTTWDLATSYRAARGPWRREAAELFVKSGWAPSFVVIGGRGPVLDGARDADVIGMDR